MLLIATLLTSNAWAANCDAALNRIDSLTKDTVVSGFVDLAKCDRKLAETHFPRFLGKATDADVLVELSLKAIEMDVWNPLWTAIGKIQSFEARDEVTRRVGESCSTNPKIIPFLEGAYFGLREADFQQWDDAFIICTDPALATWLTEQVKKVPSASFDEKYDVLLTIYVRSRKADALPALAVAAIKAGKDGGPFDSILARMGEAVAPDMGSTISPENQQKLTDALVSLARQLPADKARSVANQLANSGADAAAASLLPIIYADRLQGGNGLIYGAAAIEVGDCKGKKSAVIHVSMIEEPGKRWTILSDIEGPMRGFKAKLKSCTVDTPWAVLHSPEPLKSAAEIDAWAQKMAAEWAKSHPDYKLTVKKEKSVGLP